MFTCNNLNLLTFTYYLKVVLAISMTLIPLILTLKIYIQTIKYKEKNKKLDNLILKKNLKNVFYIFIIFILSLTLHNTLNTSNNKCYMYAKKDILKEYKETFLLLKDENLSDDIKSKYLENVLLISYNNLTNQTKNNLVNKESYNTLQVVTLSNNLEELQDETLLKETNLNKLNNVYVQNGVFYYPKYVSGNRLTYSGTTCPSNPTKEGYNNPYGYNNYFYTRLTKFIEEASKAGHKITMSTQGCRTYDTQVHYYNTMTRGRAAYPGYSLHGFGIASDLEFYRSDGSVCPYGRTGSSCPSMGWAHQNASRFGLTFPLLYASYREDWHIEPVNKSKY